MATIDQQIEALKKALEGLDAFEKEQLTSQVEQQIENLEGGPGPTTIAEGMPGPEADKYISSLLSPTGGPPPSFLNPPPAPSLSPEEQQNLGRLSGGVPPPEARALQLGVGDLTDEAIQKYIDELNASVDKAEVDAELSNLAGVSYIPTSLTPPSPVPEAPTLPSPVPEAPTLPSPGGGGIPSLNIDLQGTGLSLARGNESGILGTPQPGPPIGEDLQTAIRDQARAAEDAEAGLLPSEDQVRDAFLESLDSEDRGGKSLQQIGNIASGGITGAKHAFGVTIPPAIVLGQLVNAASNIRRQSQADRLIHNPTGIGTLMRGILPEFMHRFVPGLHETVQPGGGLPFHPTSEQSRVLGSPPGEITPPPRPQIVPVTTETLDPPSDDFFSSNFGFSPEEMSEDFGGIV